MREFLRSSLRFLEYTLGRNRRIAWIAVAIVAIGYVAGAFTAWALKQLTDAAVAGHERRALIYVLVVVALWLASRGQGLFAGYVGYHQYASAAHDLERHLLDLDLTLPRVDHLEDPTYVDRFDLLRGDVENLV